MEMLPLHTSVPQIRIIRCMAPEIWSPTDNLFVILDHFMPIYPASNPKRSKLWKNEKQRMEISYFKQMYQKSWSYATLILRYNAWQM